MADRPARILSSSRRAWLAIAIVAAGVSPIAQGAAGSDLRATPIVKTVQSATPSVVNIRGEKTVADPAGAAGHADAARRVNGMGTGVVIDPRGYIITNHHVVDGVREIQVTLYDGQQYIAKLVSRDPETDLAIIKIEPASPLKVIKIGSSADLMPGETVVAVGNAYGYDNTVTQGIVSALHRAVQVSDAQYYEDLIQTDASINPGNSGGPLLNIDGEMIGINVAVRAGAQGIGFAIPVDKAMAVAAQLLASRNAQKSWHGIRLKKDGSGTAGAVVDSVDAGSPAAEDGVQPGDVITAAGGQKVERPLDFQRAMLDRTGGEDVELALKRDGEGLNVALKLTAAPEVSQPASSLAWELFGMELEPIPAEQFRQRFQTHYRGGLTITSVRPNGPAAAQGIQPGDILVGMHIWETISLDNVAYVINQPSFANLNPVKFYILRGNETLFGYLPVPPTARTASRQ